MGQTCTSCFYYDTTVTHGATHAQHGATHAQHNVHIPGYSKLILSYHVGLCISLCRKGASIHSSTIGCVLGIQPWVFS